jgi:hypothetical protein
MATLQQAIEKLSVCIAPSTKYARPLVRIHDGVVTAYNGTLAGSSPFTADFPTEPLVVDADSLRRVWVDGATAHVRNGQLVIRTRRTSYTVRILDDVFECPELKAGGEKITAQQRAAILLAAKFSSVNAQHAWACAISVRNRKAVATNNLAIISVDCDTKLEGVFPSWAVQAMQATDGLPEVRIEPTGITFSFPDSTVMHSAALSVEPPTKLFELVEQLGHGTIPLDPIQEIKDDAFRVPGRRIILDQARQLLCVESDIGATSETDVDLGTGDGSVILQEPVFRLILDTATHIGFEESPGRLLFSTQDGIIAHGVVACMV